MTCDSWEEVNLLSKCQLPSSYGLGVRGDMWHLTCDTWNVTHDIWHASHDMQGKINIVSKFQVRSSYGLGVKVSWKIFSQIMIYWINEWQRCLENSPGYTGSPNQSLCISKKLLFQVKCAAFSTPCECENWPPRMGSDWHPGTTFSLEGGGDCSTFLACIPCYIFILD